MSTRTHIKHQPIAESLRTTPGEWGEVRACRALYNATAMAKRIRQGLSVAYCPAGAFEAEVRRDADGEPVVYARYVGPEVAA